MNPHFLKIAEPKKLYIFCYIQQELFYFSYLITIIVIQLTFHIAVRAINCV